jgi:quaternary ammonium compound-resistance protein SugE
MPFGPGIGTVGAAILGMILFDEPRDIVRMLCIMLIIARNCGLETDVGELKKKQV